jgi:hypothetical protein
MRFLDSIFFTLSPFVTLALVRHRRKEKRFGPSPANDYTEGYGGRKRFNFFGLGRKRAAAAEAPPNPNALPEHSTPNDLRHSYAATEETRVGSRGGGGYGGLGDGTDNKFENIPLGNYPNASRYQNSTGVYQ